jgi:hypothetical protein
MAELQRLMLLEIRKQDGCADVTDVGIYHVTDERAENNWSASVVGCGSAAPDVASRAAVRAQETLQYKYDLLPDSTE